MAAVALRNISKVFGGKRRPVVAVDDLTLEVGDRELVVLLGPSGCGKTTTLRLVAGLETLSGGSIEIGGRCVNEVAPKDRDVAMVFQDYALYPHMTVYDNLAFGLKMRRTPKGEIRRRVEDGASLLQIEDLLARKPHSLSGGQKQRVAFGRAIVRRPNVYLFDEPLANLDAQLRLQLRVELKRMQRDLGMTALYVTHDQHEAMALGDRVVVMREGRMLQCGTPLEVYDRPANRFVAGFVGTPPMNFIVGRLEWAAEGPSFVCPGARVRLPGRLARSIEGARGRPIVLGIRPERVRIASSEPGGERVRMTVVLVEPFGDRLEVHGRLSDGQQIIARAPAWADVPVAVEANVCLDPEGVVLFEPGQTGANVEADRKEAVAGAA